MLSKRVMFQVLNSSGRVDISIAHNTIDAKELQYLYEHFDTVYFLQPMAYSYDCVQRNLIDLNSFIGRLSDPNNKLLDGMMNHFEALNSMSEIQQRITNVLSSANTFLNLVESKLKSKYGKESDKIVSWDEFRKAQHSHNVSYRLMYELRNYALHYGLPVSSIKFNMSDLASENPRKEVKINLSKGKMLESGYNWKKIRKDIEDLDNDNNIIKLIFNYAEILKNLYDFLLNIFDLELNACKKVLVAFFSKHAIPSDCTAQIVSGWNAADGLSNLNYESLPTNELIWILRKNA